RNADGSEDFLEFLDLVFRLGQMGVDSLLEVGALYRIRHFRERLGQCIFRVVDVLEGMLEQFSHRFHTASFLARSPVVRMSDAGTSSARQARKRSLNPLRFL